MDPIAILAIVSKGITVYEALMQSGLAQKAFQAIMQLKAVVVDKKEPTAADLDRCEAVLDSLIDEFNLELPAEG